MFEWFAGPLWVSVDGDVADDYGPEDINEVVQLSDDLLAEIGEWNDRMQRTYNDHAPQDSGMTEPADEASWVADGRRLAHRLKSEAGRDVRVEYAPLGGQVELIDG
ncbi:hypothetical protein [Saccharomonospora saliphila]|uniref:hypothetical protein n=1 Tax=Saccharomonospora saliphila TaxID=369829 RepID=UPI000365A93F|nr:hypothetical protein [Saccharomonospora saliphila]